jgi:hypothetical protein
MTGAGRKASRAPFSASSKAARRSLKRLSFFRALVLPSHCDTLRMRPLREVHLHDHAVTIVAAAGGIGRCRSIHPGEAQCSPLA